MARYATASRVVDFCSAGAMFGPTLIPVCLTGLRAGVLPEAPRPDIFGQ
jgi:hypothetical protein